MTARTALLLLSVEADHLAPWLTRAIRALTRKLDLALLRPYHPERHYMRGPGPRWHEKHTEAQAAPHGEG